MKYKISMLDFDTKTEADSPANPKKLPTTTIGRKPNLLLKVAAIGPIYNSKMKIIKYVHLELIIK